MVLWDVIFTLPWDEVAILLCDVTYGAIWDVIYGAMRRDLWCSGACCTEQALQRRG